MDIDVLPAIRLMLASGRKHVGETAAARLISEYRRRAAKGLTLSQAEANRMLADTSPTPIERA